MATELQTRWRECNPFGVNAALIFDTQSREGMFLDPGMINEDERSDYDRYIVDKGIKIKYIAYTHLHLDHCFGDSHVRQKYGVDVLAHSADAPLGMSFNEQCRRFGLDMPEHCVTIDRPLNDGDTIYLGESVLEVLHVPGHSPGSLAFYLPSRKLLFSGDALFRGSIGRTDLYGGDQRQLIKSIKERLLTLPGDTCVVPGHGSLTYIDNERNGNPYLI